MKVRKSQDRRLAGLALLFILLYGCQTGNGRLLETAIETQGAWWHHTDTFAHLIIPQIIDPRSGVLHVYIEGDGQPWFERRYIARDPSPKNPLALRLMMRDPQNSLYLGRPCYFMRLYSGHVSGNSLACEPMFWTSGRYSKKVVDSMVATLDTIVEKNAYSKVVLIGYSGGGTLAYLMASRTEKVDLVVTVAANLDHNAWADYHGYSLLSDSLDPTRTKLPRSVSQLHLRGARDRNVPQTVTENFTQNGAAKWITFPAYDHVCCWERDWLTILDSFIVVPE